ncbi:MAG: ATP-binding protein [Candidatus Kapabacteria bacterium]|jgi:signal transduction histidine kinase|nr:ATP-binding protein [Candidatus Kapabacteria bacterium]
MLLSQKPLHSLLLRIVFAWVLSLILMPSARLSAQERFQSDVRNFEYRLRQIQEIRGAEVIMCQTGSTPPLFFEFKPRAYGVAASDVAAIWRGTERSDVRRGTLEGASVFAATAASDSSCVVLLERRDTLFVAEIGTELRPYRLYALPAPTTSASVSGTPPAYSTLLSILHTETFAGAVSVRFLRLADGEAFALTVGNYLYWLDWRKTEVLSSADSSSADSSSADSSSAESSGADSSPIRYCAEYSPADVLVLNPYTRDDKDPALALLRESGLRKDVMLLSPRGRELWMQSLDVQQRTILRRVSNYSVAACTERGSQAYITLLKMGAQPVSTGIAAKIECLAFAEEQTRFSVFAIANDNVSNRHVWTAVRLSFNGEKSFSDNLQLFPERLVAPLSVTVYGDEYFCLFGNALVIMGFNGEILSMTANATALRIAANTGLQAGFAVMGNADNSLYLVRIGRDYTLFQRERVPFWWLRNLVRDVWLYAVALSVFGIIISLLTIVRYQRRLLTTLFGVPEADVMLIVDSEGKLLSLNDSARTVLGIALEAPMRRLFQFYCTDDSTRVLAGFVREAVKNRRSAQTTITFRRAVQNSIEGTEPHDYLFSAVPIQTRFGAAKGTMFIGKDITEELGKKKLGSWSQLGHDLQTNLAAIRLNAEKLSEAGSLEGKSIVYQARLVQQRIKDIITIGKSEQLEMKQADAADICRNVCKEFDKTLYPNVAFHIEAQHVQFSCAQPQLERALRNAVENGIKRGLRDNTGVIKLTAELHTESGQVRFTVSDNGRGMNDAVLKKMMQKGFTTFESTGGSGLGTMIMQYIVRAHEGEILVESEEGKGTRVAFHLPARGVRLLAHKPLRILPGEVLDA